MMDIKDFEQPWQNDKELMKMFLQHGVSSQDLASLNCCRMYLQAVYLSDICNAAGTVVDAHFWEGQAQCQTHYIWPRKEMPTKMNGKGGKGQ